MGFTGLPFKFFSVLIQKLFFLVNVELIIFRYSAVSWNPSWFCEVTHTLCLRS